jgi:hypothetical protein
LRNGRRHVHRDEPAPDFVPQGDRLPGATGARRRGERPARRRSRLAEPLIRESDGIRHGPRSQVGDDAWTTLVWANGRIALPDRPRRQSWAWDHSVALAEGQTSVR